MTTAPTPDTKPARRAPPKPSQKAAKKKAQPAPKSFAVQSIELLPFVKTHPKKGTGRDWWVTPQVPEDLAQMVGEGFAREFVRHTRRYEADGSSFHLVAVIEHMVKKGRWTDIEYGFVATLALALNGLVRT